MEVPLLGQSKAQDSAVREVEFALLLVKGMDGQITLSTDVSTPITTERLPIPDEVMAALNSALKNLEAQQVAAIVLNGMVNMSQMAMQAQANQDIMRNMRK